MRRGSLLLLWLAALPLVVALAGCSQRPKPNSPSAQHIGTLTVLPAGKDRLAARFVASIGMAEPAVRELARKRLESYMQVRQLGPYRIAQQDFFIERHALTAPVFAEAELVRDGKGWKRNEHALSGGESSVAEVPVLEMSVELGAS